MFFVLELGSVHQAGGPQVQVCGAGEQEDQLHLESRR